jgi:hypothetical protein
MLLLRFLYLLELLLNLAYLFGAVSLLHLFDQNLKLLELGHGLFFLVEDLVSENEFLYRGFRFFNWPRHRFR